jgi:hypothetical protein
MTREALSTEAACAGGPARSSGEPAVMAGERRRSSTAAASVGWSNGAPAQRDGSATSNAATAGTAPAWTAGREPRSGAATEYSPTTWSKSAPWPANQQGQRPPASLRGRWPGPAAHGQAFSGRSKLVTVAGQILMGAASGPCIEASVGEPASADPARGGWMARQPTPFLVRESGFGRGCRLRGATARLQGRRWNDRRRMSKYSSNFHLRFDDLPRCTSCSA